MPTKFSAFSVFLLSILILWTSSSCKPEIVGDPFPEFIRYEEGIYITNEGPFISGTGTVSFFDPDSDKVSQSIFQEANNGLVIGNILHSMAFHEDFAYLVVNNANKIEMVDESTFERLITITGFELPRYFLGLSFDKAYVSQWGVDGTAGSIAVLDLQNFTISKTIETGSGAERMLLNDGLVYLVNEGGFGRDSILTIINTDSDEVVFEVVVGENPTSLVAGADGSIWTIGRGYTENWYDPSDPANISGKLCNVLEDGSDKSCIDVPMGASELVIDSAGEWLYFVVADGIYKYPTDGSSTTPEIFYPGYFYELYWDAERDLLLAADPVDFASPGQLIQLDSNGDAVGAVETGIIPGYITRK